MFSEEIINGCSGGVGVEDKKGWQIPSICKVWVFDEFVACVFPIGYSVGKVSVIGSVGLVVVVNGCGGIFILGDITSFGFWDVGFLRDPLNIGGEDKFIFEFIAVDCTC